MAQPSLAGAPPIRVAIVDDHALIRSGVAMLLARQPDIRLVGEATNRAATLSLLAREQPDLLLLDLDLGVENALDFLHEIPRASPQTKVLVLTGIRDPALRSDALRLGAATVLPKDRPADQLLAAIRAVAAGEAWQPPPARHPRPERGPSPVAADDPAAAAIALLTARELQIVRLVARGHGTKRLVEELGIAERTLRNHLVSIYGKLGVSDRLDLATFAYRHGISHRPAR